MFSSSHIHNCPRPHDTYLMSIYCLSGAGECSWLDLSKALVSSSDLNIFVQCWVDVLGRPCRDPCEGPSYNHSKLFALTCSHEFVSQIGTLSLFHIVESSSQIQPLMEHSSSSSIFFLNFYIVHDIEMELKLSPFLIDLMTFLSIHF